MESFRNRIIGYEEVDPEQLLANPRNWRIHPQNQQEALEGVLEEVGWIDDIIVNQQTGFVVDGHLRVSLALSKGEAKVPVKYVDLTEEEEKLVLATIDPIAAMAATDKDILEGLLSGIDTGNEQVNALIEDIAKREKLNLPVVNDPGAEMDRADELQEKWQVERGQVWQIGDHRLMCGDATKKEDIEQIIGNVKTMAMVTDPPYNVGFDYGDMTNDEREEDVYWEWQHQWFELLESKTKAQIITPGCINLEKWISEFAPKHICVWDKGEGANTHGRITNYWAWEPIMCHGEFVRIRHTDVFRYSALGNNPGHPCPKPIKLWADIVENLAQTNIVCDPFIGSGTTMVAAQQLNRICYGMEIEPKYCAVTLERMSNMDLKPKLV